MWGALIGAGASLLGASSANRESQASTQRQMDFQKETMQNRYQWQYADMKKAGLNPIMAHMGASPGTAQGASYDAKNVAEGASNAGASITNSALRKKELDQQLKLQSQQLAIRDKEVEAMKIAMEKTGAKTDTETAVLQRKLSIGTFDNENEVLKSTNAKNHQQIENLKQQLQNQNAEYDRILETINNLSQQTQESMTRQQMDRTIMQVNGEISKLKRLEQQGQSIQNQSQKYGLTSDRIRSEQAQNFEETTKKMPPWLFKAIGTASAVLGAGAMAIKSFSK